MIAQLPLGRYLLNGEPLDSLDLKVLCLTQGVSVQESLYDRFAATHRVSRDPLECSAFFLPDGTAIHLADVGAGAAMRLALDAEGNAVLSCNDQRLTAVYFPPKTDFYRQTTSRGIPFRGLAVLQGRDVLSFPYLWPCELAKAGLACRFCHLGNYTQYQALQGIQTEAAFTPRDVAEVVHYAVNVERCARYVQLTGGSTLRTDGECDRIVELLTEIDGVAGLDNVPGETIVFTTPPSVPSELDRIFAAGANRIACDLEIWDEAVAQRICPGKSQQGGRQRHLNALEHVASVYGPNKACSAFVVGLEPAESFLAGAEYLASRGVVPVPSIWMPHGLPRSEEFAPPGRDFYRAVKRRLAEIYSKYACEPPGDAGYNVCLCRDTWNHRVELVPAV